MKPRSILRLAFLSVAAIAIGATTITGCGDDDVEAIPQPEAGADTSVVDSAPPPQDTGADTGPANCRQDEVKCGSVCSNVRTDPNNCGACGTVCAANQVCNLGQCASD